MEVFSQVALPALPINGDLPSQLPFTEKSSRNTFGLGSGHLLSITLLNGPNHMLLVCQYLSFKHRVTIICDMVPGLIVLAKYHICRVACTGIQNMASVLKHIIFGIRLINQIIAFFQKTRFIHYKFHWDVITYVIMKNILKIKQRILRYISPKTRPI